MSDESKNEADMRADDERSGLPNNIKQIGSIGEGLRVYIEDYAYTYLRQYSSSSDNSERPSFLVGKTLVIDSQQVLFINGALQGKYLDIIDGCVMPSEKSMQSAEEELREYFGGFELVGWAQAQPGYGTAVSALYEKYHFSSFGGENDVFFVLDPTERSSAFYIPAKDDRGAKFLDELSGYFVYYDKNPHMQEYMLDNKMTRLERDAKPSKEGVVRLAVHGGPAKKTQPRYALPRPQGKKSAIGEGRRLTNMLVGLSAVLFLVCFIMGAGLLQSDGRISKLETDISSVVMAYDLISRQITAESRLVFAETPDDAAAPASEPALKEPPPSAVPSPEPAATQTPAPSPTPPPAPSPALSSANGDIPDSYVVQKGDNLNYISMKFYGTTEMAKEIMKANGLSDPDKIFFGKILILPRK